MGRQNDSGGVSIEGERVRIEIPMGPVRGIGEVDPRDPFGNSQSGVGFDVGVGKGEVTIGADGLAIGGEVGIGGGKSKGGKSGAAGGGQKDALNPSGGSRFDLQKSNGIDLTKKGGGGVQNASSPELTVSAGLKIRMMMAQSSGQTQVKTYTGIISMFLRIMAHSMIFEPELDIKDASSQQAGNQALQMKFVNATAWAKAMGEMIYEIMDDGNASTNIELRTGITVTQTLVAVVDCVRKLDATLDALGVQSKRGNNGRQNTRNYFKRFFTSCELGIRSW